jgi:hypothetical protein
MCWRKGIGILPMSPSGPCRPRLTAAQGPRVEQRAILARTRCATAALLRERGAAAKGTSSIGQEESLGENCEWLGWNGQCRDLRKFAHF